MESDRDTVLRALCAARDAASGRFDIQTYQCYDKAFVQLATDIIAEAEIIIAHTQDKHKKDQTRQLQTIVEKIRSAYPAIIGNTIDTTIGLTSSARESLGGASSLANSLDIYTHALQVLSNGKEYCRDELFLLAWEMTEEEIAQYKEELFVLSRKLTAVLLQRQETGGDLQDQRHTIKTRVGQIKMQLKKLDAARKQPDSLIELMLY